MNCSINFILKKVHSKKVDNFGFPSLFCNTSLKLLRDDSQSLLDSKDGSKF